MVQKIANASTHLLARLIVNSANVYQNSYAYDQAHADIAEQIRLKKQAEAEKPGDIMASAYINHTRENYYTIDLYTAVRLVCASEGQDMLVQPVYSLLISSWNEATDWAHKYTGGSIPLSERSKNWGHELDDVYGLPHKEDRDPKKSKRDADEDEEEDEFQEPDLPPLATMVKLGKLFEQLGWWAYGTKVQGYNQEYDLDDDAYAAARKALLALGWRLQEQVQTPDGAEDRMRHPDYPGAHLAFRHAGADHGNEQGEDAADEEFRVVVVAE